MEKRFSLADQLWVMLFVGLLGGVTWLMFSVRASTLASSSAESQQNWDDWREAVKEGKAEEGGVVRRVPKSAEPPALVLMRDHFAVCLSGALVLSSVLFGAMILMMRGAFASTAKPSVKSPSPSSADP
jgi:hypothetical protein